MSKTATRLLPTCDHDVMLATRGTGPTHVAHLVRTSKAEKLSQFLRIQAGRRRSTMFRRFAVSALFPNHQAPRRARRRSSPVVAVESLEDRSLLTATCAAACIPQATYGGCHPAPICRIDSICVPKQLEAWLSKIECAIRGWESSCQPCTPVWNPCQPVCRPSDGGCGQQNQSCGESSWCRPACNSTPSCDSRSSGPCGDSQTPTTCENQVV